MEDVRGFYEAIGVPLTGRGTRNVMIRCFANPEAHSHGDKVKSCSVALDTGQWNCKACGAKGGPFDAAVSQGIAKREAAELVKKFGLWIGEDEPPKNVVELDKRRRAKKAPADRTAKPADRTAREATKRSEEFKATDEDVARYRTALLRDETVQRRLFELRGWTHDALANLELGWDAETQRVTFPIRNATGELVGLVRYQPDPAKRGENEPKSRADVGSARELFPAPETMDTEGYLFLVEGEPDAVMGVSFPLPTTGYPGTGGWKAEWAARFAGRRVCIVTDADGHGRARARAIAADLYTVAAEVRILELFEDRQDGSDLTSFALETKAMETPASRAGAANYLRELASRSSRYTRGATQTELATLPHVVETFRRYLYLPDIRPLLAVLGTVAGNYLEEGVPVWLLLVGPSGGGKTALVETLGTLEHMHEVTTFTPASLLSGTSSRERAKDATGGLLREMGRFGIALTKDFTSTLAQHPVTRDESLAALREIYDGRYVRLVGTEGGRRLEWPEGGGKGKMGLIGGVTDAIDEARKVTGAMGERLLLMRLETSEHRDGLTRAALRTNRQGAERDVALAAAVRGLFAYGPPRDPEPLTSDEEDKLVALAMLCAYCRSHVERDRVTREIEVVYEPEVPTRLVQALESLLAGLSAIGVPRAMAMSIVAKVAIDSAPSHRQAALSVLYRLGEQAKTSEIAAALGHGDSKSTRRALEELAAHGVVDVEKGGEGRADTWRISEWSRAYCAMAAREAQGAGTSAGKVADGFKGVELPKNPLQSAISEGIRPAFAGTVPATFTMGSRPNGASRNGSDPSSNPSNPSNSQLKDAGKVPALPHGSTEADRAEASRGPSPRFDARSWVETEGWRRTDDEIDVELRRHGIDDGDIIGLLDVAYDRRREEMERD